MVICKKKVSDLRNAKMLTTSKYLLIEFFVEKKLKTKIRSIRSFSVFFTRIPQTMFHITEFLSENITRGDHYIYFDHDLDFDDPSRSFQMLEDSLTVAIRIQNLPLA